MGGLKALYRYAHPRYPVATFGMLVISPLDVDEMIGRLIEVDVGGGLVKHLELEQEHFSLLSYDRYVVNELESTGVDFGFNPQRGISD